MKDKPELVCPAGEWSSLVTAVDSGADSIYFGVKGLNMRAGAENFDVSELKKIMAYLHDKKTKGYLALNVMVQEEQLAKVGQILREAQAAEVDAVICWDMGVAQMAGALGLPLHLSTQAGIANSAALSYYAGLGFKRAVLARECTLKEIQVISKKVKEQQIRCQIEAFIHGAMCVSVSGRCFLSAHAFGKSANQGECVQPCRREFTIIDKKEEAEFIVGEDYLLSPKDLCTIDFIDRLIETGVSAFKIEGRMRAVEYIKMVVSAYRQAIDAYFAGTFSENLKESLKNQLAKVYNRGFSTGFYFGVPVDWRSRDYQKSFEKIFLGEISNYFQKIGVAEIFVRNEQLRVGDTILITGKTTPATLVWVEELQINHESVQEIKRGERVGVKLAFRVRQKDQVYLWREKKEL